MGSVASRGHKELLGPFVAAGVSVWAQCFNALAFFDGVVCSSSFGYWCNKQSRELVAFPGPVSFVQRTSRAAVDTGALMV